MLATGPTILPRHRFTVDEYLAMGGAGILDEDSRVELIDGDVIDMAPIGELHAGEVRYLDRLFQRLLMDRAIVSAQNPIQLSTFDHPQPDIVLLRFRPDLYRRGPVLPTDVLLLIEVADSTLRHDREAKLPRYAAAGIPEVWIVDLNGLRVEVYRRPVDSQYTEAVVYEDDQLVSPQAFPDITIPANDILP